MTLEALKEAIKRLITKRATADQDEQTRLNAKLDRLYNIKYLVLEQERR